MPCMHPKSNYGSRHVCCADLNGRGIGLQYCASSCVTSTRTCYYDKISADDVQVQSISHIDKTECTYCKIVWHAHYMPHQRGGRQMMRRQCPKPPLIGSLEITYVRHMCNCRIANRGCELVRAQTHTFFSSCFAHTLLQE
jgi:hypothetical protein